MGARHESLNHSADNGDGVVEKDVILNVQQQQEEEEEEEEGQKEEYPIPKGVIPCTNPLLEIKYSPITGRGVYAKSTIPAWRTIECSPILLFPDFPFYSRNTPTLPSDINGDEIRKTGVPSQLGIDEVEERGEVVERVLRQYTYSYTTTTTIDTTTGTGTSTEKKGVKGQCLALGLGSIFNHSNQPNVKYQIHKRDGWIEYVTAREIQKGEELVIYYGNDTSWMCPPPPQRASIKTSQPHISAQVNHDLSRGTRGDDDDAEEDEELVFLSLDPF